VREERISVREIPDEMWKTPCQIRVRESEAKPVRDRAKLARRIALEIGSSRARNGSEVKRKMERIDLFSEIYISRSKAQLKGWNF
jgi:hypothetical protein